MRWFIAAMLIAAPAALFASTELNSDDQFAITYRLAQDGYLPSDRSVTEQEELDAHERFAKDHSIENTPDAILSFMVGLAKSEAEDIAEGELFDSITDVAGGKLADPFSAQYRSLFQYPGRFACGEVNAKNQYGAYTGWQMFAVDLPATDKAVLDESISPPMATIACKVGVDPWP